jgi:heterotetrameric sarcosine oxidase gamma subunit
VAEVIGSAGAREVPLARSAIRLAPPLKVLGNWEVSARSSSAALRLADLSALAKVHVRSQPGGGVEHGLGVVFGRARRDYSGNLVIGEAPGEWLVLGPCGREPAILAGLDGVGGETFTTVIDLTHGFALVRLTGGSAPAVFSKLCPVDLSPHTAPSGSAWRTSLAGIPVCIVRDDIVDEVSYLCYCERSFGQYLFDVIMDAGAEFAVDVDGHPDKEI